MRNLFLSILLTAIPAFGQEAAKGAKSVKIELSLGLPNLTITNPDGSKANYDGLAGAARGFIPIMADTGYRFDLTGGLRYLDFDNKANNSNQSEAGQYVGPGLGLEIAVSRFYVGANYFLLKGRHTSVGVYSKKTQFDVKGVDYYAGMRFELGLGSIGLAWSQMNSTVPATSVNLSSSSKWSNQTIWLQFTYNFKTDTGQFIKSLFSK